MNYLLSDVIQLFIGIVGTSTGIVLIVMVLYQTHKQEQRRERRKKKEQYNTQVPTSYEPHAGIRLKSETGRVVDMVGEQDEYYQAHNRQIFEQLLEQAQR